MLKSELEGGGDAENKKDRKRISNDGGGIVAPCLASISGGNGREPFSHKSIHKNMMDNADYAMLPTSSRQPGPFDGNVSLHTVIVCRKSGRRCRQR